ncbi:uncharacterized protein TRUGW13939_04957 [Talaromyces rugulosus]|uniref:Uncharacterized protein n=1 Tax=Talaromyces rugulosus TaxID=121627 RepID=A0A7H8QV51_TALRU|nr:uncharacterized protein TRUGW13939_04957 [Talaromyces rugulosus]QKX57837.1 hypothetical protein TRUGW13939_04957 [Talaromyces rugulosus]
MARTSIRNNTNISFNFYQSGPGPKRVRRRSSRYYPRRFEQRTADLEDSINYREQDWPFSFPRNKNPHGPRQKPKKVSPTRSSTELKDDVFGTFAMMEERLNHHRSNFMATQDRCALMLAQIFEEAIPILQSQIDEAASLLAIQDVDMADAPPVLDVDDDGDWCMVL